MLGTAYHSDTEVNQPANRQGDVYPCLSLTSAMEPPRPISPFPLNLKDSPRPTLLPYFSSEGLSSPQAAEFQ